MRTKSVMTFPKKPFVSIVLSAQITGSTIEDTFVYLFGGTLMNGREISGIKYPMDKIEVLVLDDGNAGKTIGLVRKWKRDRNVHFRTSPIVFPAFPSSKTSTSI